MSSLYSDPQWSTNMNKAVSRLSDPGVELEEALAWWHERTKEEYFSLSDTWGVLISAGIMKQVPERHYFYISNAPLDMRMNRNIYETWRLWFG